MSLTTDRKEDLVQMPLIPTTTRWGETAEGRGSLQIPLLNEPLAKGANRARIGLDRPSRSKHPPGVWRFMQEPQPALDLRLRYLLDEQASALVVQILLEEMQSRLMPLQGFWPSFIFSLGFQIGVNRLLHCQRRAFPARFGG